MQIQQTQTKYDNFVLVNIAFSAYSGLVTLDKSSMGTKIDPKLISAGEIKTVSREHLKVFGTLKAKARSRCLRFGTSFMGGYAIPVDKWDEVQTELLEVQKEYEYEANKFISNYNNIVNSWADEYHNDRELILSKAHSLEWIKGRFTADYFGCTLSPAAGMDETMSKHVDGMFDSICKDIATDAKQAIRAYQKGSKITTKMKQTFEGMIDKIKSLAFVNSSLEPIGNTIKNYIDGLFPVAGKVDDEAQGKIAIILIAMSDPENLPNLAEILQAEKDKVEASTATAKNDSINTNELNDVDKTTFIGSENANDGYSAPLVFM